MSGAKVGFIGLGNMGGRMSRCLVAGGTPVLGYDKDEGAAERYGVTRAASPREVVEQSEIILLSLPDSTVIEKVIDGYVCVLNYVRAWQCISDITTASSAASVPRASPSSLTAMISTAATSTGTAT